MASSGFKHLVVVKFKEDAKVDEILKGLEKLVSEIDAVKSFEWGVDNESHEMLRQGFTHAFIMTFENKEAYVSFTSHPNHVEFSTAFSAAIDKIVVLDFPVSARLRRQASGSRRVTSYIMYTPLFYKTTTD